MKRLPRQFDWLTVLERLSNGEEFNHKVAFELTKLAGNWPTCACGQLCQVLERKHDGTPIDERLQFLGMRFYQQVHDERWCFALRTFLAIEKRTTKLLKEGGYIDERGHATSSR